MRDQEDRGANVPCFAQSDHQRLFLAATMQALVQHQDVLVMAIAPKFRAPLDLQQVCVLLLQLAPALHLLQGARQQKSFLLLEPSCVC